MRIHRTVAGGIHYLDDLQFDSFPSSSTSGRIRYPNLCDRYAGYANLQLFSECFEMVKVFI